MRILTLTILLLSFYATTRAQESKPEKLLRLGLGYVEYEKGISNELSAYGLVGLGYSWEEFNFQYSPQKVYSYKASYISTFANAGLRWHYSRNRRIAKKRNVSMNCGPYWSFDLSYSPSACWVLKEEGAKVDKSHELGCSIGWWWRQRFLRRFMFDAGISLDKDLVNNEDANLALNLRLTWNLVRPNKR